MQQSYVFYLSHKYFSEIQFSQSSYVSVLMNTLIASRVLAENAGASEITKTVKVKYPVFFFRGNIFCWKYFLLEWEFIFAICSKIRENLKNKFQQNFIKKENYRFGFIRSTVNHSVS